MSTFEQEIITKSKRGTQIAYLKRQEDGRYTINAGTIHDSGYDTWFSTEATTVTQAKDIFKGFLKIWFSETDTMEKFDELDDVDVYTIDPPDGYY